MRTVLFSICLAALVPLNVSADESSTNTSNKHVTERHHTNAIEIILEDHKQIKKMIAQLEKNLNTNTSKSRTVFNELKPLLKNHETMEQKVWYPELEKHDELKSIVDKLIEEEKAAADELKELDNLSDDKEWVSKVKKLIKDVKAHARDEETKLFPKVKKILDKSQLDQIGKELTEYKNEHEGQS